MPHLLDEFRQNVVPKMMERFGYRNTMQVPRLRKIVLNMGLGEATRDKEITKDAVRKAIEHPLALDLNRVNAQQARRVLDRLVGYKVSPFLWKTVYSGLSAGRVQSVALRLV